ICGSMAKPSTSPVIVGTASAVDSARSSGADSAGSSANWGEMRSFVVMARVYEIGVESLCPLPSGRMGCRFVSGSYGSERVQQTKSGTGGWADPYQAPERIQQR